MSVAEGSDGRALLHCHSGCAFETIMRALALDTQDAFPPSDGIDIPSPGRSASKPASLPRTVAATLVESGEFAWTWEAGKELAKLDPSLLHEDVLRSWDYLIEGFDVPALVKTAHLIRGVAMFRYCNRSNAGDPAAARRAVQRLIWELEHEDNEGTVA